jgi:hypothetical protein
LDETQFDQNAIDFNRKPYGTDEGSMVRIKDMFPWGFFVVANGNDVYDGQRIDCWKAGIWG